MLKPSSVIQKTLTTSQYDYTMQSTNFSITVSIQMCNFSMNAALFRRFACRPAAFFAVWGGQTERETPLADFKLHAARFLVCVGLLADRRITAAVCKQTLFQGGVVSADIDKRLEELQTELLKLATSNADYDKVGDEIHRLRDQKQKLLLENANRDELKKRMADMSTFLKKQSTALTEYNEQLVRRLIEKVTIYEDKFTVEFKSGVTVDVDE